MTSSVACHQVVCQQEPEPSIQGWSEQIALLVCYYLWLHFTVAQEVRLSPSCHKINLISKVNIRTHLPLALWVNTTILPADVCPNGYRLVNCPVNPCLFASCPADGKAACVVDSCGTCTPRWISHSVEVTEICRSKNNAWSTVWPSSSTLLVTCAFITKHYSIHYFTSTSIIDGVSWWFCATRVSSQSLPLGQLWGSGWSNLCGWLLWRLQAQMDSQLRGGHWPMFR